MDDFKNSTALAKGILHDRSTRRKYLSTCVFILLGFFAAGLWLIRGWLEKSPLLFISYWAVVMLFAGFIMLFALYDAASVIKEERNKKL